jgi:CxxC-x17-CxxC domain-containing protein
MFQGNWTCSSCGAAIGELPFEPRSTTGLMCRDCHSKSKGSTPATTAATAAEDKPKVAGNWTCSSCGAAITSLPFTPRDTSNLLCSDCFKKKKGG